MRVEFIGAVYGEIELADLFESQQGYGQRLRLAAGAFRCRDTGHLQALGDLGAEQSDEMRRRCAGAEFEVHPGRHELQRGGGGPPLCRFRVLAVHGKRLGCEFRPVNLGYRAWTGRGEKRRPLRLFRLRRADHRLVQHIADRHHAGAQIDPENAAFPLMPEATRAYSLEPWAWAPSPGG